MFITVLFIIDKHWRQRKSPSPGDELIVAHHYNVIKNGNCRKKYRNLFSDEKSRLEGTKTIYIMKMRAPYPVRTHRERARRMCLYLE